MEIIEFKDAFQTNIILFFRLKPRRLFNVFSVSPCLCGVTFLIPN